MYDMDLKGTEVLDAGCGTGILAILAAIKEAAKVDAYDIDEWQLKILMKIFR